MRHPGVVTAHGCHCCAQLCACASGSWTRCMALAHFVIASQSRGSRDASRSPGGGSAPGLPPLPTGLRSRSPDACALHPVCCIHTVLCVLACIPRVSAATCSCWMSLLQPRHADKHHTGIDVAQVVCSGFRRHNTHQRSSVPHTDVTRARGPQSGAS